jgi:molybdopterin synthase catalytic subunit
MKEKSVHSDSVTMEQMIRKIKDHPDFSRAGMILAHNGIVRATSRDGRPVTGLEVAVDHGKLKEILHKERSRPGILDIQVHIRENTKLTVGEDVMFLVVAGDIRENVIQTLTDTLNQIKSRVTSKTQFFQ